MGHHDTSPSQLVALVLQRRILLDEASAPKIAHASMHRRLATISSNRTTNDPPTRMATITATASPVIAKTVPTVVGRVGAPIRLSTRIPMKYQRTGMKKAAVVCAASSCDAPLWNRELKGMSTSTEANSAGALMPKANCSAMEGGPSTQVGTHSKASDGRGAIQCRN